MEGWKVEGQVWSKERKGKQDILVAGTQRKDVKVTCWKLLKDFVFTVVYC